MKVEWERVHYADGAIEYETPYVNGEPHGIQKWYYEDGTVSHETPFVNGQQRPNLTKLDKLVLFGVSDES